MEVSKTSVPPAPLVFLTGVSGYIGGRLLQLLEDKGVRVRCLVRNKSQVPAQLKPTTQYIVADVADKKAITKALSNVDVAYYLIHSMGSSQDFSDLDREYAAQFASIASKCGVKKIIYLGGLGSHYDKLSPHLKSRQEVGQMLRLNGEGVQVIEFRASIVIGSGSLSFEMIRALVERLPVMITPKWVRTEAQPIAIEDLLAYLYKGMSIEIEGDPIFEIGGADRVTYQEIMSEYARQRGYKRLMIPVPFLTPRLSSLWLGLVTPIYARVGRKLVESAMTATIVHDPLAARVFNIHPMGLKEAIARAIRNENHAYPATRWNDPVSSALEVKDWSNTHFGGTLSISKYKDITATKEEAFKPIREIGGKNGYYFLNFIWWLRGFIDLLLGGVGMRRGRRDPTTIKPGDVIDFWRVIEYTPDSSLKLVAEMKVPGLAFLEFNIEKLESDPSKVRIKETASLYPEGVFGVFYWYLLYPIHIFIFKGMLNGIVRQIKRKK